MEKDPGGVREKLVLVVLERKEITYYWYHNGPTGTTGTRYHPGTKPGTTASAVFS